MPWHASPKKRLRRDAKKQSLNKSHMSTLRTIVKKTMGSLGDPETIKRAQKTLDKMAAKGIIHRNAAARRLSRLMRHRDKILTKS